MTIDPDTQAAIDDAKREMRISFEGTTNTLQTRINANEAVANDQHLRIEGLERTIADHRRQIADQGTRLDDQERVVTNLRRQIADHENRIDELRTHQDVEIAALRTRVNDFEAKINGQFDTDRKRLDGVEQAIADHVRTYGEDRDGQRDFLRELNDRVVKQGEAIERLNALTAKPKTPSGPPKTSPTTTKKGHDDYWTKARKDILGF